MSNVMKKFESYKDTVKTFLFEEVKPKRIGNGGENRGENFEKSDLHWNEAGAEFGEEGLADSDIGIEKILEENRKKAASIQEEFYQKGYTEGKEKGFEEALENEGARLAEASKILENLIQEMSRFKETQYKNCEEELLEIIIVLTKKLLSNELSINKDVVLNVVRAAISGAVGNDKIKIIINPEDHDNIAKHKEEFLHMVDGLKNISVAADSSISKGGCLIETDYGDIDARLDKQLENVEENLKASLSEE